MRMLSTNKDSNRTIQFVMLLRLFFVSIINNISLLLLLLSLLFLFLYYCMIIIFLVKALLLYSYIHVLCAIWLLTYILKYFKYRITCILLEDCIILLYYWHIAEVKCKMKWNVLTIDRWSVLNYVMVNYEWTCLSNVQRIYCTYWGISCTTCA